jgi:hypothetical protein
MVHSSELFSDREENVIGWKHSPVQTVSEIHTGALLLNGSRLRIPLGSDVCARYAYRVPVT